MSRQLKETRIRLHYLKAMENGDFEQLPSKAHERGFLRAYAEYLGLDPESLLSNLDQQEEPEFENAIPAQEEAVQKGAQPLNDSQVIFEDLGEQLRKQRELLGFSIQEIERNIHIREHYLAALEAGNINGLPSPVQGRGMLQNYASFLSLDVEAVLLKYADGLQAQLAEKRAARPVDSDTRPLRRGMRLPFSGIFPGDWILRAVLIIAVLAFVVWGVIRISAIQAARNPVETVPPIADALQATQESGFIDTPQPTEDLNQEATEQPGVNGNGSEPVPAAPEEIDSENSRPNGK